MNFAAWQKPKQGNCKPRMSSADTLTIIGAKYLIVVPLLLVCWEFWRATVEERHIMLRRGILAGILAIVFAKIGGALYSEPRPFVSGHFTPLIPHEPDNGFPSDHTLLAFTCAFLLFAQLAIPEMLLAILFSAVIAFSRIRSGLHSPLDIGASIVFAAIAVGISTLVFRSSYAKPRQVEQANLPPT